MFTGESRARVGPGVLVLRHEDYERNTPGCNESSVIGLLGKNVKGRRPSSQGGSYIDVGTSIGNIMPWMLWPKDTRKAPGQSPVWGGVVVGSKETPTIPTKVTISPSGASGSTRSGGTVNALSGMGSGQGQSRSNSFRVEIPSSQNRTTAIPAAEVGGMLPVQGQDMHADKRFSQIGYAIPMDPFGRGLCWPRMAKGLYGVALPATNESQQVNTLYPADPRLIAVNDGDEPDMGSLVCDTDTDGNVDMSMSARLQSVFRVIARSGRKNNSIALQLTFSENEDCEGGLVIDHFANDVIGRLSFLNGGFIDVGDKNDLHQQSFDDNGNPINPAHLSLQSLFKSKTDRDMDGPLLHDGYYKGAQDFPFPVLVKFQWDPVTQTHRWLAKVPFYTPNEPTKGPTPVTPSPPGKPTPVTPSDPPKHPDDPKVPWDPDGGTMKKEPGDPVNINPPKPIADTGKNGAPPPKNGAGEGGGGVVEVGPLPPGSGFPKWKNPDGTDPFWPFGFGGGKNGSEAKQKKRAEKAAAKAAKKKAKKEKNKNKPKVVGLIIGGDDDDKEPPEAPIDNDRFKLHWWGKPPKGGIGKYFGRPITPPPPNVFSPNIHPGGPSGGSTPSSTTSPGMSMTPPGSGIGRGPMPAGAIGGPHTPPALAGELMSASWVMRPQNYSYSAPDLRYDNNPKTEDVILHDRTTPIVGHAQAYGAQGGAVGGNPGLAGPRSWIYTVAPRAPGGRWWQGSANGGTWTTTPETDLADMNTLLNPPHVTQSTTYIGAAPRVYFGVGLPDLAQGGMFLGYRWGVDRIGNATFDRMDADGLATPILEMSAGGLVNILPRGNGAGEGGQMVLHSPDGSSSVSIQAPDSAASNLVIVLPDADPVAGDGFVIESVVGDTVTLGYAAAQSSMASIFGQTADQTVGGTGTETTIIGTGAGTVSVPTWSEGMSARVLLRGAISTIAVPGAVQIRGKLAGATNLDTGAVNIIASLTGTPCEVEMILTCRDLSDPANAVFAGYLKFTVLSQVTPVQNYMIGDAVFTGVVDTTVPTAIDITFDWGTSNAGNTITTSVGKIDTETP